MWYFVAPQIIFGEGALQALDELDGRRALIVTDANLVKLGLAAKISAHLHDAGLDVNVFDAVEPDPSVETVQKGVEQALGCAPDWIIGLGGGSAMDAAKAIWVLYQRPDLQPAEINPFLPLGVRCRCGEAPKARLILIPTTCGTGSEATWAIVLTDSQERRKMGLGNRENIADIAIVDPSLIAGLPPRLVADTALDALTHAIEGYTCTWHTDLTDGLCLQALRLVWRYLPRAVADGADSEARERLHNAATCAGLGFGNAMASLAHAMGHALGAALHIPHGRAVALFLPYTIEFAARTAPERCAEMATFIGISASSEEAAARALASRIRDLIRQVGNPICVADMGISQADYQASLGKMMDDAFNDTQIVTAAREPSYEELLQLYQYAFDGRPIDF